MNVHLPIDSPERVRQGALDARAVEGVMLGYGDLSHSYLVWLPHIRQVRTMRAITRLPLSQRWSASKLEDIDVTKKDIHAGRGARAVPFSRRHREDVDVEAVRVAGQRNARRLELRQSDFDPALGATAGRSIALSVTVPDSTDGETRCACSTPRRVALASRESWR